MTKIVADPNFQPIQDLENEIFVFGAPFSAYLCGDVYSEENKCVYNYVNGNLDTENGTTAWQSVFPVPAIPDVLPDGGFGIVHIDDPKFQFKPYTFQDYLNLLPEIPEGQNAEDLLSPTELAVYNRCESINEEDRDKTPQWFVSTNIIGDKFTIIDIEL